MTPILDERHRPRGCAGTLAVMLALVGCLLLGGRAYGANATDNFNRADGAIDGTLASDGIHTWTAHAGAWAIASNRLTGATTEGQRLTIDCGAADVDVIATLEATNGGNVQGIMVRHAGANNYAYLVMTNSTRSLVARVSGSNTTLASGLGAPTIGEVYRIHCVGDDYSVYVDGGGGETLLTGPHTIAGLSTNTQHGFYANYSNGDWDDFSVIDLSAAPSGNVPVIMQHLRRLRTSLAKPTPWDRFVSQTPILLAR